MAKKPKNAPKNNTPENVDPAEAALFREVDEDLRHEQMEALWKRFGTLAIGVAVGIVAVVAGYQGWQSYQKQKHADEAGQFASAATLAADGKTEQALAAFNVQSANPGSGFGTLASLRVAALKMEQGDRAGAQAVLDGLSATDGTDPAFRDLATILSVMSALETGQADALMVRLKPLTVDNNPWRFSALELTALLAKKVGDTDGARGFLTRIVDDPNAPTGVRTRSTQQLEGLGGRQDAAPEVQ